MRRIVHLLGAAAFTTALAAPLPQDDPPQGARLPNVFASGMVLQRDTDAPMWGWAEPGAEVAIQATWSPERTVTTADAEGRWRASVPTPGAGGPFTVVVASNGRATVLEDVLVGEVWLCSGQSNMEWELYKVIEEARGSAKLPDATLGLDRGQIRFFDVEKTASVDPLDDANGAWFTAQGQDTLRCSAVAYFFACKLQDELDVPIGLLVSAWGGTTAQAWTGTETVSTWPHYAGEIARATADDHGSNDAQVQAFWTEVDGQQFWSGDFRDPRFDDSRWPEQVQPATFEEGPIGEHDGVGWYRRSIDVPEGWDGASLELVLPPIDDVDETFWNGERIGGLVESGAWGKTRRYVIPASQVTAGEATIAIRALDTGGPGGFNGQSELGLRNGDEFLDLSGPWRVRRGPRANSLPSPPMPVTVDHRTPSALHGGMIAPLIPFGIRGVTWYQGESNRSRATEYAALFPAMIVDWRSAWGDLALPFYFVQLAPYDYGPERGDETAIVREGQARALELPATGMALTGDIGNAGNIHPLNKWDVGERLARFALRDVHGRSDVEADGPSMSRVVPMGAELRVEFEHLGGGLTLRGLELLHFEVAGSTGEFTPATAHISEDGQAVILSAAGVPEPTDARYLWSDSAEASLMGGAGLPAAPFRTR